MDLHPVPDRRYYCEEQKPALPIEAEKDFVLKVTHSISRRARELDLEATSPKRTLRMITQSQSNIDTSLVPTRSRLWSWPHWLSPTPDLVKRCCWLGHLPLGQTLSLGPTSMMPEKEASGTFSSYSGEWALPHNVGESQHQKGVQMAVFKRNNKCPLYTINKYYKQTQFRVREHTQSRVNMFALHVCLIGLGPILF